MKKMKKWMALLLAVCMTVPNVSGMVSANVEMVQAAEETSKTWSEWIEDLSKDAELAVSLDAGKQTFQGNRAEDVSGNANAVKSVETGSIILRFKANSTASTGVILGARNSAAALPSDLTKKDANASTMMLTSAGKFRFVYSYDGAEIFGPYSFTDGNWHTVVLSGASTGKNIRITIDGVEKWSISNRTDLVGMFSRQSVIDTVSIGGYQNGTSVAGGFQGAISDVIVTGRAISDEEAIAISEAGYSGGVQMGSAIADTMLNTNLRDNTWLFVGGEVVQGGFSQTRGIRNYVGQFEEYIRWTVANSPINGRQRFTFNTAREGLELSEIVANFQELVKQYQTKAVVYMVGVEDYSKGIDHVEEFQEQLQGFIEQGLTLKSNQGFVIIQKPFAVNDAAVNAAIESYCAAVDAAVETFSEDAGKYKRILVVDHYTKTKDNADFKANKLENNKLNAKGHLEISRQFAEVVVNYTGSGYPRNNVVLDRVELKQPEEYLDIQPKATATADSLKVKISKVEDVSSWKYEVDMEGTIVSGTADTNEFEITGLVNGKSYVLKIQSEDGTKQLVTTKGVISNGSKSKKNVQEDLDENQQVIAELVAGEESVTWLFMGDSITHASGLTYGYDGIAQVFEEFIREGLGRKTDIVLNTAVANANTNTTIQELDQRLTNYSPDVISMMIGTNDCSANVPEIPLNVFETNMKTLLNTMKEKYPDAVIILRSMTPVFKDGNRQPYMESYMNVVKELAAEYNTIYVDQYTALKEATDTYAAWLPASLFTDNLHPEANGHRIMSYQFIKALGLWTEDLPMTNLFYSMNIKEENHATVPDVIAGEDQIGVSVTDLESKTGFSFGDVVLKATSQTTGQSYEISVKDGENFVELTNLPGEDTYKVEVSAHLTTAAKKVTFAAAQVTIAGVSKPNPTPEVTPEVTPEEKEDVSDLYPDVKDGAWYEAGVQFVYDNGLMSGSNGLFNPAVDITRAQIVTTLFRLAGEPEVTDTKALTDFADVAEGKYYTDAVCWAYAQGIATGSNGKFDPTGKLTRQQMAAFFYRFAEFKDIDTAVRGNISAMLNADKVSSYAKVPVEWAVGAGLISGSEVTVNGNKVKDLNPRGNTTRAQVAVILQRFCENNEI